jgi:cell division transport system permease protein
LVTYKNIYDYLASQLEGSFINILAFDPFAYQVSVLLLVYGKIKVQSFAKEKCRVLH